MGTRTEQNLSVTHTWNNGATSTDTFKTVACYKCSVIFAMTSTQHAQRLSDGRNFYCPNGHDQHFTTTDKMRLEEAKAAGERRAERLQRQLDGALDDAQAQRRTAAALKGHLTRQRNRAAKGMCPDPSCRRSFHSLAEHVRTEHPELVDSLPE